MNMENVISAFEKIISVCKEDGCDFIDLSFEDAEQILALLKEQEAQRDYEASVDMAEYCERYEQTYNPEDGSM